MGNLGGIRHFFQKVLSCWDEVRNLENGIVRVEGVSALVDLEGGHACGCIGGVIAGEFSSSEVEIPIILSIAGEGAQHVF